MRTREKRFVDYGIDEGTKKLLFEMARLAENRDVLLKACEMANNALCKWLFDSLTNGTSYYGLEKMCNFVPAKADDFYAYRRKSLYYFKMLLEKGGE